MMTRLISARRTFLCLVMLALPVLATAADKRIYIAADDHTDYFWSADDATYRQAFLDMIDYYLDLADRTAGEPADFQSRWNCDGNFWMWTYERNRSPAEFSRLISRIRDGHISVPLNALVSCYGGTPVEAVIRGMYYAGSIERRYGLRFPLAVAMENQTLPYGLGALWAGAGARYSWRGICGCDTNTSAADRQQEIYWWLGPDGSKILMKWNSMPGNNQGIGGYAEARNPAASVDFVDSNAAFIKRFPFNVIGVFGKGWDDLRTLTDEFVAVAKAKTSAGRRVIVSNEQDFFQDFEQSFGNSLPNVSCTFGNEWELYVASMAEVSARAKRSTEKLRSAEALATLVNLVDGKFMSNRSLAREQAWMDLGLFWEHNWGVAGPQFFDAMPKRIAWQRKITSELESYVDSLYSDAARTLGKMIRRTGSNLRFYAFNPLSWTRTDLADLAYNGAWPCHVIDLTSGQEIPSQLVQIGGERRLRILAPEIPPVGYKVFEVAAGAGQSFSDAASVSGSNMSNQFYELVLANRGAITSLKDKSLNSRELVQAANGRALNDLGAGSGSLHSENAGPVSVTLVADSDSPLKHSTKVTLVRDSRRIEISNEILQNFNTVETWDFGFNLASPDTWHEEVGAITRAKLLGAGGHYSPRNARYDWLTLNHFVDMGSSDAGITLSNADCYYMKLGNSRQDLLDVNSALISVLAGGVVTGSGTPGIPNQGGDSRFLQRFALQSRVSYNAASAMRFALEHQNPLVAAAVSGGSSYPEASYSLLAISNPNVMLWAVKPAEDGIRRGVVVRAWNMSAAGANTIIALKNGIASAKHLTHIETELEDVAVSGGELNVQFAPQQILTFRVLPTDFAKTASFNPGFAHVAVGGGYETVFSLVNSGGETLSGNLILTDSQGLPLTVLINDNTGKAIIDSSVPLRLGPGACATLYAGATDAISSVSGWARVASLSGEAGGVASFQWKDGNGLKAMAGVLGDLPLDFATIPVDNDSTQDRYTGLALANPNEEDISVHIVLLNEGGEISDSLQPAELNPLGPHRQVARFLHEFKPALAHFRGSLVLVPADGKKILATALIQNKGFMSALPALPGKAPHIH